MQLYIALLTNFRRYESGDSTVSGGVNSSLNVGREESRSRLHQWLLPGEPVKPGDWTPLLSSTNESSLLPEAESRGLLAPFAMYSFLSSSLKPPKSPSSLVGV